MWLYKIVKLIEIEFKNVWETFDKSQRTLLFKIILYFR